MLVDIYLDPKVLTIHYLKKIPSWVRINSSKALGVHLRKYH
jgi:hypothetical protein